MFPHDQDTSGFFITIFKKLCDFEQVKNVDELSFEEVKALLKEERKEAAAVEEESKAEPKNKEYLAGIEFKPKD